MFFASAFCRAVAVNQRVKRSMHTKMHCNRLTRLEVQSNQRGPPTFFHESVESAAKHFYAVLAMKASFWPCVTVLAKIQPCVNFSNLPACGSIPGMMEVVHLIKNELAKTARNKWMTFTIMRHAAQKFSTLLLALLDLFATRMCDYSRISYGRILLLGHGMLIPTNVGGVAE